MQTENPGKWSFQNFLHVREFCGEEFVLEKPVHSKADLDQCKASVKHADVRQPAHSYIAADFAIWTSDLGGL